MELYTIWHDSNTPQYHFRTVLEIQQTANEVSLSTLSMSGDPFTISEDPTV